MVGKIDKTPQLHIFKVPLLSFIREDHELCLLANKIDWDLVEQDFSEYYCLDNGRPSIPIRKVVGVILLRRMFNLSDESVVGKWRENPYWQYFCGEVNFQHEPPFDPTELIKFRKRVGETGAERLLKLSIDLFERKEVESMFKTEKDIPKFFWNALYQQKTDLNELKNKYNKEEISPVEFL